MTPQSSGGGKRRERCIAGFPTSVEGVSASRHASFALDIALVETERLVQSTHGELHLLFIDDH